MAYTSAEFRGVRRALLACNDADRAYLRRWLLRWVDDHGRIKRDAEALPEPDATTRAEVISLANTAATPQEGRKFMDLPHDIQKCVAYIAYLDSSYEEQLAGTCTFVSRPTRLADFRIAYAVTARHVVDNIKELGFEPVLRVNCKPSGAKRHPIAGEWRYHPDPNVDLAAARLTVKKDEGDDLDDEHFDHYNVPWQAIVPDLVNGADPREFYAGDDVFAMGLFYQHSGTQRNIPIVRLGSIAALPEEPVRAIVGTEKQHHEALVEAYLVETRSQQGLSGSPAFVVPMKPVNTLGLVYPTTIYTPKTLRPVYFLGVMTGHFGVKAAEFEESPGQLAKVNVGISVVVPHNKLVELFETDAVKADEEAITAQYEQA
jgi:hypothetical protein